MALSSGTRLGAYEITGQIGAGGMGEVYRATDTTLGRDVAIKTLPPALANDEKRLARFKREARLLAALNHAHIASVYTLDEHEGTRYLAMELVEGETLEQKLTSGALPVEVALQYARQIAEALEAAHEKGVVHRDLKPANIMVTPEDVVKVLDFGLAKDFAGNPNEASPAHSPTLSLAMTQQGLVLGTAGYMSPEQASGQATDQRADVWSFGVVLYEMLTGLPVFSGESVPHILAAVLQTDPDWGRLPENLHPRLRLLLERCLAKKPHSRLHSIADARIELDSVSNDPTGIAVRSAQGTDVLFARPRWGWVLPISAALVMGALVAGSVTWTFMRLGPGTPAPVSRFSITPPPTEPLANLGGNELAISPDGLRLVYFSRDPQTTGVKLYVRDLDTLYARAVPGTEVPQPEGGAMNPFVSADGQWVGFRSPGQGIIRASLNGEPPLKMIDDPSTGGFGGGSWAQDGTLIYSSGRNLYRVSAGGGGTPVQLTAAATGMAQREPVLLPGGRAVLFTLIQGSSESIALLNLETDEQRILIDDGVHASYAPTGHIVFISGSTLMAAPFDLNRLAVTGDRVALLQGIRHPSADTPADYALSDTGTLVYVPGGDQSATSALVWVDRDGRVVERAVSDFVDNPRHPRLSPDGERLAVTTGPRNGNDVWVYDLGGRPPIPLATEDDDQVAVWNPDGTRIAFLSVRNGASNVYTTSADGSVLDAVPLRTDGLNGMPAAWSARGELISVLSPVGIGDMDIVAISADGRGNVQDVVATPADEYDATLSPNDRWLAYTSNRTGEPEVWVQRYPDGGPIRISHNGGYEPIWSPDGQELFYLQGNTIMSVAVNTEGEFSFDPAVELFTSPYLLTARDANISSYDVARDGRFLMVQTSLSSAQAAQIVVVQNWFEELKRDVPTK